MKLTHTPLVVGNWKMNPPSLKTAVRLFSELQKGSGNIRGVDIGIAAPAIYLAELSRNGNGKRIHLVAQDSFWEKAGAWTGQISTTMLKSVSVRSVIVGHSERRMLGETDDQVNKKIVAALKDGLRVIVCVGENERDVHGNYLSRVEIQLRAALSGVPKTKLSQITIAYEPVWAIGTGKTATPSDAHEMKLFIQKVLSDLYGRPSLSKVRILYGGSVNAQNAAALYQEGAVDGFLVGGASLQPKEFISIIKHTRS